MLDDPLDVQEIGPLIQDVAGNDPAARLRAATALECALYGVGSRDELEARLKDGTLELEQAQARFAAGVSAAFAAPTFPVAAVVRQLGAVAEAGAKLNLLGKADAPLDEATLLRHVEAARPGHVACALLAAIGPSGAAALDELRRLCSVTVTFPGGLEIGVPQQAAVQALASIGGAAAPAAEQLLAQEDLDHGDTTAALAAIAAGHPGTVDLLRTTIRSASGTRLVRACDAVQRLGAKAAVCTEELLARLERADDETEQDFLAKALVAVAGDQARVRACLESIAARADTSAAPEPAPPRGRCPRARAEQLLARIAGSEKHDKTTAIAELAAECGDAAVVVPILVSATSDADYGFCTYEGCVTSAFELLLPFATELDAVILARLLDAVEGGDGSDAGDRWRVYALIVAAGRAGRPLLPRLEALAERARVDDPLAREEATRLLRRAIAGLRG